MQWMEHKRMRWIVPLVMYTVAALLITWPLVGHLSTRAAGAGYGDSYEVTRHVWWAREALLKGQNPFDQPLLVYPDGFMSWVQWAHPLQYLPAAVIALVVDPLTAFNLMLIITVVLNGLAAYWLGLRLNGGSMWGALVGGLVLLALPTVQGHLSVGHLGIASLYPVPLFALCLWGVVREDAGWRTVAAGAVWFALAALVYISQPVYVLLPLIGFFALGEWLSGPRPIWHPDRGWLAQPWLRVGVMIVGGVILLLPFYAPLLTEAGRAEMDGVRETGVVTFSADPLAFVSPSPLGWVDDLGLVPDYARDVLGTNSAEGSAYLGLIAVALALWALRDRTMRVWVWIMLGAMVLSLGPLLKWRDAPVMVHVEDAESYVTLPWAALQRLPLLESARAPGRFNLTTGIALSALVSVGAARLFALLRRDALRSGVLIGLAAVMIVEFQVFGPFATDDAHQPAYFADLAQVDDVRAVLNLPTDHSLAAKYALYQQTLHGKPLIAGHALRRTTQDPALLAVLDRALLGDSDEVFLPALPTGDMVPALLNVVGADRVILQKYFVPDAAVSVARLRDILGAPEFEDEQIAAFAVPPVEQPLPAGGLFFARDEVAWLGGWMGESGAWYLYATGEFYGELVIPEASFRIPRLVSVKLDGKLIGAWWIRWGELRLPVWIEDAGFHALEFTALAGCTDFSFSMSCLDGAGCVPVDTPYCLSVRLGNEISIGYVEEWVSYELFSTELIPVEVMLDHGLRLRAYDVPRTEFHAGDQLDLRLYWEAARAIPASYALFAHVSDPVTGVPLAQYDAFPLITTDQWVGGARWVSEVAIPLPDDLPPGEYALNVGWFDPATGTRLAVQGDQPGMGDGLVQVAILTVDGRE